jgi:hypothetical protein
MRAWLASCGPTGWTLIAGTLVVLVGLRTRLAGWFVVLGLGLLAVGAHLACFDGRPHLNPKLDATAFVWARAVWLRALAGLAALVLAAPLGQAAARLAGARRGWLDGLLVLGSFGLGLLGSSLVLQATLRTVMAAEVPQRLAILRGGVAASTWLLLGSAGVAVAGAVTLAAWRSRADRAARAHAGPAVG